MTYLEESKVTVKFTELAFKYPRLPIPRGTL